MSLSEIIIGALRPRGRRCLPPGRQLAAELVDLAAGDTVPRHLHIRARTGDLPNWLIGGSGWSWGR